jgi:hypothetical protein
VIPIRSAEQVFGLFGLSTQYMIFIISLQMFVNFAPSGSFRESWTHSCGSAAQAGKTGANKDNAINIAMAGFVILIVFFLSP